MTDEVGISGFAVYVPPYRVDLESWCRWTNNVWDKTRAVVGHSFRMRGPAQSVYTMAATAVMRLIDRYDIDPHRVGFLGLGTESSTDNSAGAVIVKGMLDEGLQASGRAPLSRHCEVPEVKHACLGGVYALKHALRYLALEPEDRCAIVVSADIAEYARGSSGEPTQGAGAVAMLVERNPTLLTVHLEHIGSASSYRAVDFRKPVLRNIIRGKLNCHFQDLPVFNGKYSTTCYLDETLHALNDMARRMGREPSDYYRELAAIFMHRPYHRMPEQSFAMSYLFGLGAGRPPRARRARAPLRAREDAGRERARGNALAAEHPAARQGRQHRRRCVPAQHPAAQGVPRQPGVQRAGRREDVARLRADEGHRQRLLRGAARVDGRRPRGRPRPRRGPGRPQDARRRLRQRRRRRSDSDDRCAAGWRDAAAKIGFEAALEPHQDLTQQQYETLHDTGTAQGLRDPEEGFVIQSIGSSANPKFSDEGIEYYRFVR